MADNNRSKLAEALTQFIIQSGFPQEVENKSHEIILNLLPDGRNLQSVLTALAVLFKNYNEISMAHATRSKELGRQIHTLSQKIKLDSGGISREMGQSTSAMLEMTQMMGSELQSMGLILGELDEVQSMRIATESAIKPMLEHLTTLEAGIRESLESCDKRFGQIADRVETLRKIASRDIAALDVSTAMERKDILSGCINRQAFFDESRRSIELSKQSQKSISVIACCINKLDDINRDLGRTAGDTVICVVAKLLREVFGSQNELCRYGGADFLLLLEGVDTQKAAEIAKAAHERIAEFKFHAGNKPIPVSISCGVTSYLQGDDAESLAERAFAAMREAKADPSSGVFSI